MMKVFLGTDHSGFEMKNKIKGFLEREGYEVEDCGVHTYDRDDDYPDFIGEAARGVSKNPGSMGVVIGGSGQGEAMVANKVKGVRCALFYSPAIAASAIDISGKQSEDPFEMLKLTREHNDSNVLSLGIRFLKEEDIFKAIKIFLESPFTGEERHIRRIEKIKRIEESN